MKKLIMRAAGVVVIIVLLLVFFPWDDNEVNDADLEPRTMVPVMDEDNIHQLLVAKKPETMTEAAQAFFSYNENEPTAAEFVNTQALEVELSTIILNTERFECDPDVSPKCELNLMRDIGLFLLDHAEQYATNGNMTAAERSYEAAVKLATAIASQTSSVDLIDLLISVAIINQAEIVSESSTLSNAFITDVKNRYSLPIEALVSAYKTEYKMFKDRRLYENPNHLMLKIRYFYQPNKTTNQRADFARGEIALANAECSSVEATKLLADLGEYIDSFQYPLGGIVSFFSPNLVGRLELSSFLNSPTSIYTKYCDAKVFLD